jgi:hypothetical protein
MLDDLTTALVSAHRDRLADEACSARLARLVTACRSSQLRVRTGDLLHWLRAGQIGTGRIEQSTAPLTRRACSC